MFRPFQANECIVYQKLSQPRKRVFSKKFSVSLTKVNAIFIFVYLVKADFILID